MFNRYKLPNGVRVVEEHMPSLRSLSIGIWILSGSRNEAINLNGISHLIEHMLFKGTPNRTARDIAESFDSIGGHANAFTSKEYTCLYAKVMDQHASYTLELMFDMLFNSTFEVEELEREKNVIYEEIAMTEDTPDDIIHDYLHDVSFKGHPLSQPILGEPDTLKEITREEIISYKEKFYSADRIVVSVAGNVPDGFHKNIEELFSKLHPNNSFNDQLEATYNVESMKKEKDTTQAHLCLGYQGVPISDESVYSISILNNVLGGSMSSRLFQKIREELGLTYTIFSYHNAFRDNGLLTLYGATTLEQFEQMEHEVYQAINDIKLNGITDKEFSNTVQQLKGQLVLGLENPNSRMHRNGRNELLNQPHLSLDDLIEKFESVSKQDIQEIARYSFKNEPSKACIFPIDV
ncbi:insulinase family protein [Filobacillus milosensis]|uniref:Insulinase family protein n=1 Tax=Filobacillus milosensis TaxID=94137 RepID=A0A4Y8IQU1_9BACI|nr:pitrilysin family protein [Filobacillus milosensis]TFB23164.1 insulinase family protein [Filobacillus milosensis]